MKTKIPFHRPLTQFFDYSEFNELQKFSGAGRYSLECERLIKTRYHTKQCLLTTSCTDALEMAALLIDIKPGDEVIMPSYTFVSTANAFVRQGAVPVFIDVHPETMNLNENLIEDAITQKTKAIIPVHYGGVACEMDKILKIAKENKLFVIEDAAQAIDAQYDDKFLGSLGDLATFSFHETKNLHCGEGGALLINNQNLVERAEIIREKGTNRSQFLRGQVDKYTWVDQGSSFLPSEVNALLLKQQLSNVEKIQNKRKVLWNQYNSGLSELQKKGNIDLPHIPKGLDHNAHLFFLKTKNIEERSALTYFLASKEIEATFHYVPLHSSPAGRKYGRFHGEDIYTTKESERLLRLPLYYDLEEQECESVIKNILAFYQNG